MLAHGDQMPYLTDLPLLTLLTLLTLLKPTYILVNESRSKPAILSTRKSNRAAYT
jgi:hypothetical protein